MNYEYSEWDYDYSSIGSEHDYEYDYQRNCATDLKRKLDGFVDTLDSQPIDDPDTLVGFSCSDSDDDFDLDNVTFFSFSDVVSHHGFLTRVTREEIVESTEHIVHCSDSESDEDAMEFGDHGLDAFESAFADGDGSIAGRSWTESESDFGDESDLESIDSDAVSDDNPFDVTLSDDDSGAEDYVAPFQRRGPGA